MRMIEGPTLRQFKLDDFFLARRIQYGSTAREKNCKPQNFRATPVTYNFLKTFAYNPRVTVYVTLVKESLFITIEEKSPFKKKI